jgi:hypothetical protein
MINHFIIPFAGHFEYSFLKKALPCGRALRVMSLYTGSTTGIFT